MARFSVKTKYAFATSALVLVLSLVMTLAITASYQRFVEQAISRQQEAFVQSVASRMEADIEQALASLRASARLVDLDTLASPASAQRFLAEQQSLSILFDYSLLLFDGEGLLIAETRSRPHLLETSFRDVPYVRLPLEADTSTISDPYISMTDKLHPVVTFSVPIHNAQAEVIGVLAGGVDLMEKNILARPAGIRVGQSGYLAVYTPQGVVVTHTDRSKILASFTSPVLGNTHSQPGTIETDDFRGVPVLLSKVRMPTTGWILASSYPLSELYAPIREARHIAYWLSGLCGLFAILAGAWMSGWLTTPLLRLRREVGAIGQLASGGQSRIAEAGRDEVGEVGQAINRMLDALEESRLSLERLSEELIRAEERERREIANDLHDSICQALAVANIRLGQLGTMDLPKPALEAAGNIREILGKSVEEMRTLIFDLSPPILYELGLEAALEWYSERYKQRFDVEVSVELPESPLEIELERSVFLYRAGRELLMNVAKHAQATHVTVALAAPACLRVEDDGVGLPATAAQEEGGGFGLSSIRERCRLLGGQFEMYTREGGGVQARLMIPPCVRPREEPET